MPNLILDREFAAVAAGQLSTIASLAPMAATPEDLAFIRGQIEGIKNLSIACGMYTPQVQTAIDQAKAQMSPAPAWLMLPAEVSRD